MLEALRYSTLKQLLWEGQNISRDFCFHFKCKETIIAADDSRQVKTYIYWSHFFWLLFLKLLLNLFFSMVVTRSQLENLWKDELIDRLLQVENIEDELEHFNKRFDDFLGKYNEFHSELQVSTNCSNLFVIELSNWEKIHLVQHSTLEGQ